MNDVAEQEVMIHAASRGLVLWGHLHELMEAVNECNKSTSESRTFILSGRVEAITIGISALLTTSARAVFDQKVEQVRAAKCAELAFDNMMLDSVSFPELGAKHA